ncbi:hypothetical protein [Zoogloea sp.]|uniref:hypothetical protein n=1 Tax=Zoogloea sp. TaxID=49181 RepID=UPI0035B43B83
MDKPSGVFMVMKTADVVAHIGGFLLTARLDEPASVGRRVANPTLGLGDSWGL